MRRACTITVFSMLVSGCDAPPSDSISSRPDSRESCPPCKCVCECEGDDSDSDSDSAPVRADAPAGDVAELVTAANRKMNHGNGEGCLTDLDAVKAIDPKMDARLAVTRGQCEMLVGKCQEGKERIARWYEVETAMTPERATATAEQLGAMRCRGGNSTDRDRVLVALFNLSDGAYMNTRDPEYCQENLDVTRGLLPKVTPTAGPDDSQITGGAQALFHTAASCFARAGDCKTAFTVYADLFPASGLAAIPDPAQRRKVIRDAFTSSIPRCAKTP